MSSIVTGGTGFIGAQIVRLLLEKGENSPVVFDINQSTNRLNDVVDKIEIIGGDLGNFNHVLNVVKKVRPKVIYHMGAMLSVPSEADPAASFRINVLGIYHVLEAARLFNVKQVLFSSSIGTYGFDIKDKVINDYTLQRPIIFYGACKLFGEHIGLFYRRKYDILVLLGQAYDLQVSLNILAGSLKSAPRETHLRFG